MVFERYINRHGKRLGPYYYENVRSSDGKVKTVYVGTNPRRHAKHRIRKPLFFLILALVLILILGSLLFFMQNRNYLVKKAGFEGYDFDIDQILLKVLVKSNEFIEKQLRVMNTGNSLSKINIEVSELSDIVKIDSASFALNPGNTKIVALNFSSFMPEQRIEQQPAVYVGKLTVKSEKVSREIPVVVEIETKNVLFDMNLNPVALERRVKQGSETTIEVRLFNLKSIESENVDIEYFVKDINGNTIQTESETVVVKTQASFFKTISIPKNLKPGPYVFAAQARFGSSIGTASYLFEVTGPEEQGFLQFCRNSVLCLGLSLTTMLLLFALTAYFYFFVGAYLYEKFAGAAVMPVKRKSAEKIKAEPEEIVEEPAEGVFERIINKTTKWLKSDEAASAEKEELKMEKALQSPDEESRQPASLKRKKKAGQSYNLMEFYNVLAELRSALGRKDISELSKLHDKARSMYANLLDEEKREIYDELSALHTKISRFVKEKKLEELNARIKQEELAGKTENLGKRAEEERQEEPKEKGIEIQTGRIPDRIYSVLHELEEAIKGNDIPKAKRLYIEARNIYAALPAREKHEVYRKLLELHRHAARLAAGKKRQEELEREGEKRGKKELEKQKADEERKRKKEELAKQREIEARIRENERQKKRLEREKLSSERKERLMGFLHKIGLYKTPEEKRQMELQKEREKQERLRKEFDQDARKLEELKKQEEKKPSIFVRLFEAKGQTAKTQAEEKPKAQKSESEFEELEEAIRNLGLFRQIEKGGAREKPKEKTGIFGKFFKK
ncbi:hypothetical protein HYX04_00935 [Candidatus Woesearchaeota archaeon]|nr:hypothetical protein [Candidatus Woesearchaeota archaeon]